MKRKEAMLKNEDWYNTGKPCRAGHNALRRTDNAQCVLCIKNKNTQYYKNNKDKILNKMNDRYHHDVQYKLSRVLRDRLRKAIKRNQKTGSAVRDLGCSIVQLKQYIESKFRDCMTWENYGTHWHIDHKIPLASFDLTDRDQFLKACHYTNQQPLLIEENLSKSSKLKWRPHEEY